MDHVSADCLAVGLHACASIVSDVALPHSRACAVDGLTQACMVYVPSSAYCRRGQWCHCCGRHGTLWIGYQQMAHEPQVLAQSCTHDVPQGKSCAVVNGMTFLSCCADVARLYSVTASLEMPEAACCLTCASCLSAGGCRVVENGTFDAFWDTISFGFNGLVFFFAGASATNFAWRSTQVLCASKGTLAALYKGMQATTQIIIKSCAASHACVALPCD